MGLDIEAYRSAIAVDEHTAADEFWCEVGGHLVAYCLSGHEQSLRGLTAGRCYDTSAGESVRHAAGSYPGYNHWRDRLAHVQLGVPARTVWESPDDWRDKPFFELIMFADNEGFIGPDAAADLLVDFEQGRSRWIAATTGDVSNWDRRKYDEWITAFRTAARHGLVRFG